MFGLLARALKDDETREDDGERIGQGQVSKRMREMVPNSRRPVAQKETCCDIMFGRRLKSQREGFRKLSKDAQELQEKLRPVD